MFFTRDFPLIFRRIMLLDFAVGEILRRFFGGRFKGLWFHRKLLFVELNPALNSVRDR